MGNFARIMVFHGAGQPLEARSDPLPQLQPGEVLVKVRCCTLCGSDLHTYSGRRQTPCPTILGHEILGEVAALPPGSEVLDYYGRPLAIGQRITWSLAVSCGTCFYCSANIPQKCASLFKFGHEAIGARHSLSGGLAEYCRLPAGAAIVPIPDELDDAVACPANCAAATICAALRTAGDLAGQSVLVQGAGMLGLTAAAFARAGGARDVIVCDVDAQRLQRALEFGATQTVLVDESGERLADIVGQTTSHRGVDVALELSGSPAAFAQGLAGLRIGGRYLLVGAVFPGSPASLDMQTVVRRLLRIEGVHNYAPQDLAQAVSRLADLQHQHPFSTLVSRRFALSAADEAFRFAIDQRPLRVAVVP